MGYTSNSYSGRSRRKPFACSMSRCQGENVSKYICEKTIILIFMRAHAAGIQQNVPQLDGKNWLAPAAEGTMDLTH